MDLIHFLGSLAFFLLVVYLYLSWQYDFWRRRGIPSAQGLIPGLGHMLPVISAQKSMGTLCEDIYKETKNYSMCGMFQMCTPVLFVHEPELIKSVFVTNFSSFSENTFKVASPKEDELLSLNPFFAYGDQWKKARAPLTNSFSSMKLKMMLSLIQKVGSKMTKYLSNKCREDNGTVELDLKKLCHKFTGEVSSTGLGIEANNFEENLQPKGNEITYNEILNTIFDNPTLSSGLQRMILIFIPSLAKILKLTMTPRVVDKYFRQVAKSIIATRKMDNKNYNDFMQFVLEYQKDNINDISEETLAAAHMLSFAADVYETTAVTMSFLIFDLASHPDIQEKVRHETRTLVKKYNGELTYEALREMTYLEKVLSESQRMNHFAGFLSKVCTKEIKLDGSDGLSCVVKPGQTIIVSISGLHLDPKHWPEPEKFDPERFSEDQKSNRHKFTFLPFGEGPRICVGMRMAILMMKVAVSTLLNDFSVDVSPKMVLPWIRDENSFTNGPKGSFWVTIKSLQHNF